MTVNLAESSINTGGEGQRKRVEVVARPRYGATGSEVVPRGCRPQGGWYANMIRHAKNDFFISKAIKRTLF